MHVTLMPPTIDEWLPQDPIRRLHYCPTGIEFISPTVAEHEPANGLLPYARIPASSVFAHTRPGASFQCDQWNYRCMAAWATSRVF